MKYFDLTPDPKVLIALTHTPIQPLDALSELIDNSIDSFRLAEVRGVPVQSPLIIVDLPKRSQILEGAGKILLRDNGPGLSAERAEMALKAGFSGNTPYDSLGLFGMGFNISSGKLGARTRFVTAEKAKDRALEVIVDLVEMSKAKNYQVPVSDIEKPDQFAQGTLLEIDGWWPDGNPNKGFILKLVQYGAPKIREELGRRYSTILKSRKIQILVNGESVVPFEHCVWSGDRFVERREAGRVFARIEFDDVVGTQRRCTECFSLVEVGKEECAECKSSSFRTIEERVRGWVGIQRYDDQVEFGVDIIRNGRAIRISEKSAVFEFTDEFKKTIKDYPSDSIYGRIVGEVHLNHVPVDFLKQDFQRSSMEWQRAMVFLRGESALQQTQPGADKNFSPISKLYRGYRRVRRFGKNDMYMGTWDVVAGEPRRISRDVEREYLEKFQQKLPGFYDDAEWWKLVEQADKKPLDELVVCPKCQAQNLSEKDICLSCSAILRGKPCLNSDCKKEIPESAAQCPDCGKSQVILEKKAWNCAICAVKNTAEAKFCRGCSAERGKRNPLSREFLLERSEKSDALSISRCSVLLADGGFSNPSIDIAVFLTKHPLSDPRTEKRIPLISFKTPALIEIVLDPTHPLFEVYGVRVEYAVAQEVASYIFESNRRLVGHVGIHTIPAIQMEIIKTRWDGELAGDPARVQMEGRQFLVSLKDEMPAILQSASDDIFTSLPDESKQIVVANLLKSKRSIADLDALTKNGEILRFLGDLDMLGVIREYGHRFLDGAFWSDPYDGMPKSVPQAVADSIRRQTRARYVNCLEDLIGYMTEVSPERHITERARASLQILQRNVV